MKMVHIDGDKLKNMITYGVYLLNKNRDELDALNIFPVPDGDTGTSMSLTSLAALKEMQKLNNGATCEAVAAAVANGSLRGARGNSGVILSQLFRGLYKSFKGKNKLTTADFAAALSQSSATAYKAVMKPKEGTVLTISRVISENSGEIAPNVDDFNEFFKQIVDHANVVLKQTTNMLPALKAAGVVDAGGKGLVYIYEGMLLGLTQTAPTDFGARNTSGQRALMQTVSRPATADIKFAYCTEFFIETKHSTDAQVNELTVFLENIGDSIVSVNDEEIIKIHVHTNNPGKVLEHALLIGPLSNIKIENMKIQHTSMFPTSGAQAGKKLYSPKVDKTNKGIGIIAVSIGDGIDNIFKDLGCDYIISGGQTMNPSAEDIVKASESINKNNFIILPNNKNIILAAKQAADILEKESGKEVSVLDTTSIPQGIGAMIAMVHDKTLSETAETMQHGAKSVQTGLVTVAIKDTEVDGNTIKVGDYLGLIEGKIKFVEKNSLEAAKKIIEMFSEECELISLYYGEKELQNEGEELCAYINEMGLEGELQYGGQPVYSYVISAE